MKINILDKSQLKKLDYSTEEEFKLSNRVGSITSTTILFSNNRQDHGLLICPINKLDKRPHVLLSLLEETVQLFDNKYNLGVRRMPYGYNYNGIKYIADVDGGIVPSILFNAGPFELKKELLLVENSAHLMIKYSLINSSSPIRLNLKPFLAFRDVKSLSKASTELTLPLVPASNGIKSKLYPNYPYLYLQTSKKPEIMENPGWYYDFTYKAHFPGEGPCEDLFVPCTFTIPLVNDESFIFSAALSEQEKEPLPLLFEKEKIKLLRKACLKNYYE